MLDWFRTRFRRAANHNLYVAIPPERTRRSDASAIDATPLEAGNHYFRLWLVQMFLKNDRDWFANWHPAVHSAITFSFGDQSTVVTNVSGPSSLQGIDTGHLDRFITFNRELTALLPFNGGTVGLDAGLLAMKGKDDVRDLIKAMGDFSNLLVVPQLSAFVAVAGPLAETVGSLVGATDGQLIVGLNQTFSSSGGGAEAVLRAGYFAALDTTEVEHQAERFWVDKDQLKYGDTLDGAVAVTGVNYLLFRIESRTDRDDWESLASISQPRQDVVKALQTGQVDQAEVHLRRAIAAALIAPELTRNVDRRRVITQLKSEFADARDALGAGAFTRPPGTLTDLMAEAMQPGEAARRPLITEREAFAGLD